jgi:hypothetical protein
VLSDGSGKGLVLQDEHSKSLVEFDDGIEFGRSLQHGGGPAVVLLGMRARSCDGMAKREVSGEALDGR